MEPESFILKATSLADKARAIRWAEAARPRCPRICRPEAPSLAGDAGQLAAQAGQPGGISPLLIGLTVFVLAVFVGYHVVWRVTPALQALGGRTHHRP